MISPADFHNNENLENLQEDNEQQKNYQPLSFSESRQIGPVQDESSEVYEIYKDLTRKAIVAAERHAQFDIHACRFENKDLPVKEYVLNIAKNEATKTITPEHLQRGNFESTAPLRQHYIEAYWEAYDNYMKSEGMGDQVVNESVRDILRRARSDALQDKRARHLSEIEITCQAAIRAQEQLKLDTHAGSGYLTHVLQYLQVYEPAYRRELEGDIARSDMFPRAE